MLARRGKRGNALPSHHLSFRLESLVVSIVVASLVFVAPEVALSQDPECRADPPGPTVSGCGEIGSDSRSVTWIGTKKSTAYPPPSPPPTPT
ncbi:MAG: hypothetical protein ACRDI3_00350, partial [Actinomycetota bacterium]